MLTEPATASRVQAGPRSWASAVGCCVGAALVVGGVVGFGGLARLGLADDSDPVPVAGTGAATGAPGEAALGGETRAARVAALQVRYDRAILPVMRRLCFDCHGDYDNVGFSLERFRSVGSIERNARMWRRVDRAIQSHVMPPKEAPQPTADERLLLTRFVAEAIGGIGCEEGPLDPGHVVLRRLNREEYAFTLKDLLGIDAEWVTALLPADDTGYGFDTIGSVLTVSPLHLERYLEIAERALGEALVSDARPPSETVGYQGADFAGRGATRRGNRRLNSQGTTTVTHDFPVDGAYRIRVTAYGEQAGPDPVRIRLDIGGDELGTFAVRAGPRDEPDVVEVALATRAGKRSIGVAFTNDYYKKKTKERKARDRNLVIVGVEVIGPTAVRPKALTRSHRRIVPDRFGRLGRLGRESRARAVLEAFARRAWRRPVASDDLERLIAFVRPGLDSREPFVEAIRPALLAILCSPRFLYRVEPAPQGAARRALDGFELASRLSYFLWSSLPDPELLEAAASGALAGDDGLRAQVDRMLGDRRANRFARRFTAQWLALGGLASLDFDHERFPTWSAALAEDAQRETELFFGAAVAENLPVQALVEADFTFLNERLARHYGVPGVKGPHFRRIKLGESPRGGLLGHASILALTSNPTRTSPVKRGKWVLETLLGEEVPPPPPGVPDFDEAKVGRAQTMREQLAKHRESPNCAVCHDRMDPLGFAFERFDAVGRYRTDESGVPIDASGVLPTGERLEGVDDLRVVLRTKTKAIATTFVTAALTYALGRGMERPEDRCHVDVVVGAAESGGAYRLRDVIHAVVQSEVFRERGR